MALAYVVPLSWNGPKWDFQFSWGCSSTLIVFLRELKRNFGVSPCLYLAHWEESGT